MLHQIHFLLSYRCIFECDHCFVYSGPGAPDRTFTLSEVRAVLDEARQLGTVDTVYFEGGEPFLAYPVLLGSVRLAREMGFQVGIVTNAFFATDDENAEEFLRPFASLGLCDLSLSDDAFHFGGAQAVNAAQRARRAAERLGLPVGTITIDAPALEAAPSGHNPGEPIIGGGVVFRGRAVEKLAEGLPRRPAARFTACPHEDLRTPQRVHVDPQGNVHLCQGLSIGNLWETPLADLVRAYDPEAHPIAGPILTGGPVQLAAVYKVPLAEDGYVDACHLCYEARRALLDRFPDVLAPRNVYGRG
jgi:hypothetical protein